MCIARRAGDDHQFRLFCANTGFQRMSLIVEIGSQLPHRSDEISTLPARRRSLHSRWSCWCCVQNDRVTFGAVKDLTPNPKCWEERLQAVHSEGLGKDVARGGLERLHARKRNQLYSHHSLFCGPVRKLQFLQEGMRFSLWSIRVQCGTER